jgi:hypothetical protein
MCGCIAKCEVEKLWAFRFKYTISGESVYSFHYSIHARTSALTGVHYDGVLFVNSFSVLILKIQYKPQVPRGIHSSVTPNIFVRPSKEDDTIGKLYPQM